MIGGVVVRWFWSAVIFWRIDYVFIVGIYFFVVAVIPIIIGLGIAMVVRISTRRNIRSVLTIAIYRAINNA